MRQDKTLFSKLVPYLIALVVVLVAVVGYRIYQDSRFRVINTQPSTSSVSYLSPFLVINFDRSLPQQSLNISSSPNIVSSYTIQNQSISITLRSPLKISTNYRITIAKVSDSTKGVLNNLSFAFKAANIPLQDLPLSQQRAVLKKQDFTSVPSFVNTSVLINNGLSNLQVASFEQYLTHFAPKASLIKIAANSFSPGPHNPNTSTSFSDDLNLSIDGVNYKATVNFSSSTNLQLLLYNPSTNALVFNSGPY